MAIPWYEREETIDELVLFGRAIQGFRPYQVVIESDSAKCHSGCCSFDARKISVNPTLFQVPEQEQYQLTKALLVHEAGHRRYTDPIILPVIISAIANILEDERVESLMWRDFIGVRWLIKKLAARFYQEATPINSNSDMPHEVVSYFLQLRWAKRIGQPVKGSLSPRNRSLWGMVELLVYESWNATRSEIVNRNAAKITKILGFDNPSALLSINK